MKRKILALFLTASLAISVTACGDSSAASTSGSAQTETETETDSSESEDTESQDEEVPEETETDSQDSAEAEQETQSVDDPIAAALENMNDVTSMEAEMVLEMDMTMEADGQKQVLESITTMDMVTFTDPLKIKADMNVDLGAQGNVNVSVYADADEDGNYMMYVFDGASWSAEPLDNVDELAEYDARSSMTDSIGESDLYTLEGTETVDGVNAYKYSYTMTGDEMKETLASSGALDNFASLGLSASDAYGMLDGMEEMVTYVWVDEENLYPVKYEMDMTEVMDALVVALVEAMGEQAEGLSMHIPTMKMTLTCSNFNSAEDFSVPEEAKAAAAVEE